MTNLPPELKEKLEEIVNYTCEGSDIPTSAIRSMFHDIENLFTEYSRQERADEVIRPVMTINRLTKDQALILIETKFGYKYEKDRIKALTTKDSGGGDE